MAEQELENPEANSEKKFLLQHDRPNCIGCAACSNVAPNFWEMNADGKSDIVGCKSKETGWQETEISEKNFKENLEAAESCPVNVIHIINKRTGEKII